MTLNMQMPDFIHIVIGGIMLFTAAVPTDSTLLMQCIDDLETPWQPDLPVGGLNSRRCTTRTGLCWCLQCG